MKTKSQKIIERSNKVLKDFEYKTSLKFLVDRKNQIEETMNNIQKEIDKDIHSDNISRLIRQWKIWSGKLKKVNEKYYNWRPL